MLSSKLSLITGAGSGIGRATCLAFARENAKIVAVDRNIDGVNKTLELVGGGDHMGLELDVSSSNQVDEVVHKIMEKYSKPAEVIVNAAGITMDNFIWNITEDSFDKVIAVNLKGTFLVTQACAKALQKACTGGSIINIASIVGKTGNKGQVNYSASKAGVEGLTRSAAKDLGKSGIRCNCILPGFIDTPMVQTIPDKVKSMIISQIALGRMGKPEEIAEVILFLGSERSSFITGASIDVTGG